MADGDYVQSDYLTRPALGARSARVLSGRGTFAPGYRLVGEGRSAPSEDNMSVNIVKMVSPLTGQGAVNSGRYYGRSGDTLSVRTVRQARSAPPNSGSKVVRPKFTAIRRMTGSGQGVVSNF